MRNSPEPRLSLALGVFVALLAFSVLSTATAQSAGAPPPPAVTAESAIPSLEPVIVTAQKRSENINDVPMTITAATGEQLQDLGISTPGDLTKIVPSLVYSLAPTGDPIYTLRGVGFFDYGFGAAPAVTVYVDEVPLTYSKMAEFAALDVERVEVLKGPQGTLYGENSTGGAINYIAAKPTDSFSSGATVSYGRFNDVIAEGFLSGPLSQSVSARVALNHESADGWQYSVSRPNTSLGNKNVTNGRVLLDWNASSNFKATLNINGGVDRSDTQALQYEGITPAQPANSLDAALSPQLFNWPHAPNNARAADWDAGTPLVKNDWQFMTALTMDYDFSTDLHLKSISSYDEFKVNESIDADGTPLQDTAYQTRGMLLSRYQELRLQGYAFDKLHWIVGGNFERDGVDESAGAQIADSYLGDLGSTANVTYSFQDSTSKSVYGNGDYAVTDAVSLQGGVRYSKEDHDFAGCTAAANQTTALFFSKVDGVPIPNGSCITLGQNGLPGMLPSTLDESNVAWRGSINWKMNANTLLYVSGSKGYKAGSYPLIGAASYIQIRPVKQEDVLDVEGGMKASLFVNRLQLNMAGFHYDYTNKQILGDYIDPTSGGALPTVVNVPKSQVAGAEFQATWRPISGLTLDAEGTYIHSNISAAFLNIGFNGVEANFNGEALPYSPAWSALARADYIRPIGVDLLAFGGASLRYQSTSNAGLGDSALSEISSYATLDLRAGVESQNGHWRAQVWGRNVTDRYYWTSVVCLVDAVGRYAALPATYGITISYQY